MVYRNLECVNENTYRWHTVDDSMQETDTSLQSIIIQVKKDIGDALIQVEGATDKLVADILENYAPHINIQKIHCPSCNHRQIDVIINNRTKLREDLWRSYETDRFMRSRQWQKKKAL